MLDRRINLPTLALIGGTRVALGVGIGMLLGNRMTSEQRQACGWALFAVGAVTTIPLALEVLGGEKISSHEEHEEEPAASDRRRHRVAAHR